MTARPSKSTRAFELRPFVNRHWVALVLLAIAVVGAWFVLWPSEEVAEREALQRMSPEQRQTLYDQARRNAEALCAQAQREEALFNRCLDAASFLRAFPECDESCQRFVRAHQRGPTR